jgi:hypothetical protein
MHPRGALDWFGWNLALLLGAVLPAMLLGGWAVQIGAGNARGEFSDLGGLLFAYLFTGIPLSIFGVLFLPVMMYLGAGWPRRARALVVVAMLATLGLAMWWSLPLQPAQVAGWAVVAAGMVGWTLGIRLNRGGRPDEVEWIAALAPGALLVLGGVMYVVMQVMDF